MASFVGTPQQTTVDGTDEADVVTSASNLDAGIDFTFNGLAGNDEIVASNAGNHRLTGGAGNDRLVLRGEGESVLDGGAGDDVLVTTAAGAHTLSGGDGDDTILVRAGGAATVDGGPGENTITLDAQASATVDASTGANTIGLVPNAGSADPVPSITGFGDDDVIEFGNGGQLQGVRDVPDGGAVANAVAVERGPETTTLRADLTGDGSADTLVTLEGRFTAADFSLDGARLTLGGGGNGDTGFDLADLSDGEQIAALYVGYFGRDPEQSGFNFWMDLYDERAAEGVSDLQIVSEFASRFADESETRDRFPFFDDPTPEGADTFVTTVFQQLFDREVDQDGEDFFSDRIVQRVQDEQPIGGIILDIIAGAQNADVTALQDKIDAALSDVSVAGVAASAETLETDAVFG